MLTNLLAALRRTRDERAPQSQTSQLVSGSAALVAIDAFPGPFLAGGAAAPRVESESDLERACRQIGWLKSREETVAAVHDQCLAVLVETRNREMAIDVSGTPSTLPAYRAALTAAVSDFARDHSEIFPPGRKSRAFAGATVRTAAKPAALAVVNGDREATLAALEQRLDLPRRLQALAEQDPRLADLLPFLRIEVKLDLQGALVRWKAGEISPAQIEAAGLRIVDDETSVTVTPAQLA